MSVGGREAATQRTTISQLGLSVRRHETEAEPGQIDQQGLMSVGGREAATQRTNILARGDELRCGIVPVGRSVAS